MSRDTTRSAKVHADRSWECSCGKRVWGNGGKSSHQRSCVLYQQRTLDFFRGQLAELDVKEFPTMSERHRGDRYRKKVEDHEAALAAILARQERRAAAGASPPKETP
jgi:hypothetical protein